jgi:hypothetical protein
MILKDLSAGVTAVTPVTGVTAMTVVPLWRGVTPSIYYFFIRKKEREKRERNQ